MLLIFAIGTDTREEWTEKKTFELFLAAFGAPRALKVFREHEIVISKSQNDDEIVFEGGFEIFEIGGGGGSVCCSFSLIKIVSHYENGFFMVFFFCFLEKMFHMFVEILI